MPRPATLGRESHPARTAAESWRGSPLLGAQDLTEQGQEVKAGAGSCAPTVLMKWEARGQHTRARASHTCDTHDSKTSPRPPPQSQERGNQSGSRPVARASGRASQHRRDPMWPDVRTS